MKKKGCCFYAVDIWLTPDMPWRCEGSWERWSAYGAPKSHELAWNLLYLNGFADLGNWLKKALQSWLKFWPFSEAHLSFFALNISPANQSLMWVRSIRSCGKCLCLTQPQANVCLRNHKTVISTSVGPIVRLLCEITAFEQIFTQ